MTVFFFLILLGYAFCDARTIDAFSFLVVTALRFFFVHFLTTLLHEMMGLWCDGLTTLNMSGRLQEETSQIPFASIMEKEIWRFFFEHEKEAFLGGGYGEEGVICCW